MSRILLSFLLSLTLLSAATSIDKKISKTSSQLSSYSKNYSRLNKKMSQTAEAILRQKRELQKQDAYLVDLQKELSIKESSYKENSSQLQLLQKSQSKLKEGQEEIEQKLIFEIAQSVSLSVVLNEDYSTSEEALIEFEVLKAMLHSSKNAAEELSSVFLKNAKDIEYLNKQVSSLELAISSIDEKRKKLLQTQKKNKKALKKLQKAKSSYRGEMKVLIAKQDALKQTLERLNLVKIDTIRKAKEAKEREKAFKKKSIDLNENLPKVKRKGSSYQAVKTLRYRGVKTIAPIDEYTITKGYGTYTDPIYGIKIFNESISLKPKERNAKVKTVFNGKVIYADKTAVLNNIVIVEHANGLHTIYANLSQIVSNIKKGKKIKKGYTIGRVEDELIFEVTQKSYHINPIRLFK